MFVSIICFSCLRALRSLKSRYKTMLINAKLSAIELIDTVTSVILQSNFFLCKGLEHEGKIVTYTISAFSPWIHGFQALIAVATIHFLST